MSFPLLRKNLSAICVSLAVALLLSACASDPVLPKSDPKLMGTKAGSFDPCVNDAR